MDVRDSNEAPPPRDIESQAIGQLKNLVVLPDSIERYGSDSKQFIEWYGAENSKAICFLHGGRFLGEDFISATRPAARALAQAGYRVALPELRLEPGRPELAANDVHTLAQHDELKNAVWIGHNSGGAFALNAVLASELLPRQAILLAPIVDLARDMREDPELEAGNTCRWIGGSPEELPDRYALYDPIFNFYQLGHAKYRANALSVDIIHGTADATVPVQRSHDLRSQPFNLAIVEGANHVDLIRPDHDAWVYLLGALASVED
ncbi:alpha/beta hydrolase family protein [Trueperella bonasi]|uniref:alpha/beta hydrolase family protein n=1 Tax=Trueperella bonasi TaxID=312286 RepID=UPI0027D8B161|nr:hypothetical protein [Trueperella bonasi]